MLNTEKFRETNPELWMDLNKLLNSKDRKFPCLYAISSFNKSHMYFGVSDENNLSIENLANDLNEMSLILDSDRDKKSKILNTYIHIFKNKKTNDPMSFIINLMQTLHKIDNQEWLRSITKDMNAPEFEFCFSGKRWFPVLLSHDHPSSIRQSHYLLVAFQPVITFDYNKEILPDFYKNMRTAIHKRINDFYNQDRPYYLSEKSSGKNIVQFTGVDSTQYNSNYRYPIIDEEKSRH